MFNKILVPLDGSPLAEQALEPALVMAEQGGGEVVLLRVPVLERMLVPALAGYGFLWPDQSFEVSRHEANEYLTTIQQARAHPGRTLRAKVVDGDIASVIVDTAAAEQVDLIVMSTHGYSGLTRWVLGSVAERVLHSASCPVIVVRSAEPISNVVITLDGSRLAEKALPPALEVARRLGAQVTLLRVVQDSEVNPTDVDYLEFLEHGLGRRLQEESYEHAEAYLQAMVALHQTPEQKVNVAVRFGGAAEAILGYADAHDVHLIAMVTHGRTGLRRWVYGSVTEKVLRSSNCAMLVVRPPAEELNE